MHRARSIVAGVIVMALVAATNGQPCEPRWTTEFAPGGTDSFVRCAAVFDDGSGPALYVGGNFTRAGGLSATRIARWDGNHWSAVGKGNVSGTAVAAMTVFDDDGPGPRAPCLIVGGSFSQVDGVAASNVARWDGQLWSALGSGVTKCNDEVVRSLAVYDDGSGPALYAAGFFCEAGGLPAAGLARWDGQDWAEVGGGLTDEDPNDNIRSGGRAMAVYDTGYGPALVVGGQFTRAGEVPAMNIAAWDGTAWSALGDGLGTPGGSWAYVFSLLVHDDGLGPALYAGGRFSNSGELTLANFARWNGAAWSSPPGSEILSHYFVLGLAEHPTDQGTGLYLGAWRYNYNGFVARTSGDGLEVISEFPDSSGVRALASADLGKGPTLFACGEVPAIGGEYVHNVGQWDGAEWSSTLPGGTIGWVGRIKCLDAGEGERAYIMGEVRRIGETEVHGLASWDGTDWRDEGAPEFHVQDIAMFDDGAGPALYAAGSFPYGPRGVFVRQGQDWMQVGQDLEQCLSLAVFDDGDGPALYVGGGFPTDHVNGPPPRGIARLADGQWVSVGGGLGEEGGEHAVNRLTVYDDGKGSALYVGGWFAEAGGLPIAGVARWDGKAWSALGAGLLVDPPYSEGPPSVNAMAVANDGSDPALFVGGQFRVAGNEAIHGMAKWNGDWSGVGGGLGGNNPIPYDLAAATGLDDTRLIACGYFDEAGGAPASGLAAWDGSAWSQFGGGVTLGAGATAIGAGVINGVPVVVAAGSFEQLGAVPAEHLGIWLGCPVPCPADCDLSNSLDLLDYLCFSALFDSADPAADCDASGALDLFDFLCFVNAFNGGCP